MSTFISYRRDDAAGYAGRLHEGLERRLGHHAIFRDVDTLEPGQDFVEAINARLGQCQVFLALIGREWLDARDASGRRRLDQPHDYVRLEIAGALARPEVRFIPVLIEGAAMPDAEALPEDIRALARRHAVSVRDDAWDYDVDRLAAVIAEVCARPSPIATSPPGALRAFIGTRAGRLSSAAAALLVVVLFIMTRDRPPDAVANINPPSTDGSPASTDVLGGLPAPYGVPIPAVAEVVHPSLVYSLMSANVVPLDSGSSELRLRFQFSNEGRYDANAWDASFRLEAGGQTLAPTSGLNEVIPGRSLRRGIVTFKIPPRTTQVVVSVIDGSRKGELPLDLSPTRRPVEDERADIADSMVRAIFRTIVREPHVLVAGEDLIVTVTRGTSRRFANVVRLHFSLRLANPGRYPVHSGAATIRLAVGDRLLAPLESPNEVVAPASDAQADVVFEVPTTTTNAILKGTALNAADERPVEIGR